MSKYAEKWIAAGIVVVGVIVMTGTVIPALGFVIALVAAIVFRKRLIIAAVIVAIGFWALAFGYFTGRIFGILE